MENAKRITERQIASYNHQGFSEVEQLFRVLEQRKKYAEFYLSYPNVDKEATILAMQRCNKLIEQVLGLNPE